MSDSAPQHALSFRQRLELRTLRALIAVGGVSTAMRKLPASYQRMEYRYGAHRLERMDYFPPKQGREPRAPVCYIHGGGWIAGSKDLYHSDLLFLVDAGYPVFNLEYPLAPETPHPGILVSLLRALRWIASYYPQYSAVHFMGDSAGGNLALMLGILCANPTLIKDLGSDLDTQTPVRPRSVVSLYGVLDRLSWLEHRFPAAGTMLKSYGGAAAFAERVGPELALTPVDLEFDGYPPTYIVGASKDALAESSRLGAEALRSRSGDVTYKEYQGEGHGFFNFRWRAASQELRRDVLDFLEAVELPG